MTVHYRGGTQFGGRFSAKAAMPSWPSAEAKWRADKSDMAANAVSRSPPGGWRCFPRVDG